MAQSDPETDFEEILRWLSQLPLGMSIGDLLARADLGASKRTVQRRLNQLVKDGRVVPEGDGRGRRYVVPATVAFPSKNLQTSHVGKDWLSPEALEIRALATRPLAQRTPVGYQKSFLKAYKPNKTYYLPKEVRYWLAEIGQVGFSDLPAGTYLRQVLSRLLIDLSWNSSRLEGNTYSLLETQRLLELGEGIEGKAAAETQMILNHKAAIEMLADQASGIGFNRYTICNLHALLSDNLLVDSAASGRLRSRPVGIGGTVFHPLEVPQLIEDEFDQILSNAGQIKDPFEQAFFAMVHLPYLQPFEDVNKRVSRLAANIPLVQHNLCPLSFVDVEQADYVSAIIGVYELNRVELLRDVFVWAYQRSCLRYAAVRQSLGEPDPFRLRNREAIKRFICEVVQVKMDKQAAAKWIAKETKTLKLTQADRSKFVEVVESELSSLHGGNIARYHLRPSEFESWHTQWR